jgi:hypothetical protein
MYSKLRVRSSVAGAPLIVSISCSARPRVRECVCACVRARARVRACLSVRVFEHASARMFVRKRVFVPVRARACARVRVATCASACVGLHAHLWQLGCVCCGAVRREHLEQLGLYVGVLGHVVPALTRLASEAWSVTIGYWLLSYAAVTACLRTGTTSSLRASCRTRR